MGHSLVGGAGTLFSEPEFLSGDKAPESRPGELVTLFDDVLAAFCGSERYKKLRLV